MTSVPPRIPVLRACLCFLVSLGLSSAANAPKKAAKGPLVPERWEETIRKFEAADRERPPPRGAVLLVGGSNARRWTDVGDYFPRETVINRGFGGAHLADVVHFMDRIVLPYAPKLILLNAGGNDLSGGKSPEAVRDACRAFIVRVQKELPATRILHISLPPVRRLAQSPESRAVVERTNALIAELARTERNFDVIDLFPAFCDAAGQPRAELFVEDGVHFTARGYAIVADLLAARTGLARTSAAAK